MPFSARVWSTIWWIPRPRDGRITSISDADRAATSHAKEKFCGNIVPHERKREKRFVLKLGRHNANALPPQYYYQGPLTRGPFTCQPSLATWRPLGRPCGLAWPLPPICTCYAPPRHRVGLRICATWPCMPRRIRAPRQLRVPRQLRGFYGK